MTAIELIAKLQKVPPTLQVRIWDEEEDDYVPIKEVLWEDGSAVVDLLTYELETIPVDESEEG